MNSGELSRILRQTGLRIDADSTTQRNSRFKIQGIQKEKGLTEFMCVARSGGVRCARVRLVLLLDRD